MNRAIATVMLLGASVASADELETAREQPLVEVSHAVELRIADGVATYKVRRQFANHGKVADEVRLVIGLPAGAAATGLRIRAKDKWYDGLLMEAGRAAALYQELTGLGGFDPKDPALLSWLWTDQLQLQVFPVFPGQVSTVEYTLTAPTRYAGGRYWVSYPRIDGSAGKRLATPVVTVRPAYGDSLTAISVDGNRVAPDTPIVLAVPPREAWLEVVEASDSAGYASSTLEVPAERRTQQPIASATLQLGVTHTYVGDLRIELVTPQGKRVVVREQAGGDTNNLGGGVAVTLPPGTIPAGTWRLVVSDHIATDAGSIDSWRLAFGSGATAVAIDSEAVPVFVPDAPEGAGDAGVAAIAIAPPAISTWNARLGRVVASPEHAFGRLEIDVAPQLSKLPVRAQVVFVVDASISAGEELVAAQLATIRAYLSHVPDADVELVAYRRRATRVFGAFVPARELDARLRAVPSAFVLGNGSALDDGARVAAAALADRKGPRRVVLLTDELVRTHLDASAGLAALSPDTIVHVVIPHADNDDRVRVLRDDDHVFAPLATRRHGILAHVHGLPANKQLAPAVLELVRPTRIEKLAARGFALDSTTLKEGDGVRAWVRNRLAPGQVVLEGMLWSDPIKRSFAVDTEFSRATAAFVFGADEHGELSEAEQMVVALAGRAVSPVTSYVAFEPGTRPSTIGLAANVDVYGGLLGGEVGEMSGGFGLGGESARPTIAVPARACVDRHQPAAGWRVELDIETTRDEIVDVVVAHGTGDAFTRCLVEVAWTVRLDSRFGEAHDRFGVVLADRR